MFCDSGVFLGSVLELGGARMWELAFLLAFKKLSFSRSMFDVILVSFWGHFGVIFGVVFGVLFIFFNIIY